MSPLLITLISVAASALSSLAYGGIITGYKRLLTRRNIILLIIGVGITLGVGLFIAIPWVLSLVNPPPSVDTYQSSTDVPGMTTKVTWDTPLVQNQSIDIAACIQLDGVPATSQACVKPPKQSSPTRASHIPVQNIFGSNYDFFLVAELSASDFGIDPKEQMQ